MKKTQKFYNLIFPIWFIWMFPPIILFCGIGNFLIDAAAILIGVKCLCIAKAHWKKNLYAALIAWLCGFAADFLGALYLLALNLLLDRSPFVLDDVLRCAQYDPLAHPLSFLLVLSAVILSAFCIYHFDRKAAFSELDATEEQKKKLSLVMAIATAPYLFFLPMAWFY